MSELEVPGPECPPPPGLTWKTGALKLARRQRRRRFLVSVLTLGLGRQP